MGQKNQKDSVKFAVRNAQQQMMQWNGAKWFFVCVLMLGGIVANSYFAETAWAIRAAVGIVLFITAVGIAFQTVQGQLAYQFLKGARVELRKVVWPTRQETVQTTLVVVAMVVVSALILWGLDTLFFELVGWLAGQRG